MDVEPRKKRGRPRGQSSETTPTNVQSLERAIHILQALAKNSGSGANLTELALSVGMPPSSAHRLLSTLEAFHLVEFEPTTQDWAIGVEAFRIGSAFTQRGQLVERSRDIMFRLVDETGETANLAHEDNDEVVVLSQADTPNPIRAFFRTGTRVAIHTSGIGKALLAQKDRHSVERILQRKGLREFTSKSLTSPEKLFEDLDLTRQRGWSFDDEERYEGMRCIAAPIFNEHREAIAGISVSGPTARFTSDAVAEMAAKVKRAAAELTNATGGIAPKN